jgi:hypothetical protein
MEWVQIKSTLHALENKQYLCSECITQYRGRPDQAEMDRKNRASKACEDVREKPFISIDGEIGFKTCVGNFYTAAVIPWLEANQAYQKGILPFPGSLSEQPNKAMEIMRLVGINQSERTDRQIKKMEQSRIKGRKPVARGR